MHALRSRTGVVSITAGAAVLLALPVVAAGQVPGVGQVVGGVTETAESIAPAPAPPALPVQAPAPKPPAAVPAPAPPPAAPAPAAGAPAAPRQSAPASAPQSDSGAGKSSARSGPRSGSAAGGERGVRARAASDAPARASQDGSADEAGGSEVASSAVELPEDASRESLPFTGLQVLLIVMSGLAALAGGVVLRRSARTARR